MARPVFHKTSGHVTELRAVNEGAVPASAPATSRLFVLPVATRRWVSTDNNCVSFEFLLVFFVALAGISLLGEVNWVVRWLITRGVVVL